jgi:hypothetical protein
MRTLNLNRLPLLVLVAFTTLNTNVSIAQTDAGGAEAIFQDELLNNFVGT